MHNCACQKATSIQYDDRLTILERIRNQCPALKLLLIPDQNWERFKKFESGKRDEASHASHLVMALLDGVLNRMTTPIHKYLLDGDKVRKELISQYRKDLQEQWMFENNEIERHQKARLFMGRIVELQTTEWLETKNWTISGIEALCADHDIECIRPVALPSVVEIKYIGQGDEEFQQVINAIQNRQAGGLGRDNDACNYLMFRAYEAAQQLKKADCRHVAIIVIDGSTYTFLQIPLKHNWINWEAPSFFDASSDWTSFLTKQQNRYPTIQSDFVDTIRTLHELWILVKGNGYSYHLQAHYLFS